MKLIRITTLFLVIAILSGTVTAQNITADTILANKHFETGNEYYKIKSYDTAIVNLEKAAILFEKNDQWKKYLHTKTQIGKCFQEQRKFNTATAIIKPEIKKTLKHISKYDTIVADAYYFLGLVNFYNNNSDSIILYWKETLEIREKILGEKHADIAKIYDNLGFMYQRMSNFDESLKFHHKSLKMRKALFGEKNIATATSYGRIGDAYKQISEFDKAMEFNTKSLNIFIELLGEEHKYTAQLYNNIGAIYDNLSEYKKALEYYNKSLKIQKPLYGENHVKIGQLYSNIGIVYDNKAEYEKALEYYFKSLAIFVEQLGENSMATAISLNNIGAVYRNKHKYDKALEYYFKSLEIKKELYSEEHTEMVIAYNNIGLIYYDKLDFDKALEYFSKSMEINKILFDENHLMVAMVYYNIGKIYAAKKEFKKALDYSFKSLEIRKKIYGKKQSDITDSYASIGEIYSAKFEYNKALKYYQKGIASVMRDFNDTTNIAAVPYINNILNKNYLLQAIYAKAKIFAITLPNEKGSNKLFIFKGNKKESLEIALDHYQACDTLISQARIEMKTKSDKIALGKDASEIYKGAVNVCLDLSAASRADSVLYYNEQAFNFSEKNKSSVLLESLAGSEAMQFAGIPDSLLKLEHKTQTYISLYKQILAENADNIKEAHFRNKLFNTNRTYDSLIVVFEKKYPEYFELKYNQKPASVIQIQKLLNKKTALISYLTGDTIITIFTITHKDIDINVVRKPENFEASIEIYRNSIQNSGELFKKIFVNKSQELYKLLFPKQLHRKINNLIIIPDGTLATIPFETLLTEDLTDFKNSSGMKWKEMPYLVNDYNISYSYSANLFYKTFNKSSKQKEIEITKLDDWLAFAPVFDDKNISGTAMRTRKLLKETDKSFSDSIKTRAFTRDGMYITELPGSFEETKSIFNLFESQNKKALLKTHLQANEEFVKSGELSKYKYLHFATHGMVNSNKPELSCLILAQDTLSKEDNILFLGEIYNLKLNADLTVLSACETGLGKITEGEGVIGLTRALLYAGSKNIIVSLWPVSDESTNKLMVNFYKETLSGLKDADRFSKHLRKAKLKLIEEGKYSHPFFWSPFILIGK